MLYVPLKPRARHAGCGAGASSTKFPPAESSWPPPNDREAISPCTSPGISSWGPLHAPQLRAPTRHHCIKRGHRKQDKTRRLLIRAAGNPEPARHHSPAPCRALEATDRTNPAPETSVPTRGKDQVSDNSKGKWEGRKPSNEHFSRPPVIAVQGFQFSCMYTKTPCTSPQPIYTLSPPRDGLAPSTVTAGTPALQREVAAGGWWPPRALPGWTAAGNDQDIVCRAPSALGFRTEINPFL